MNRYLLREILREQRRIRTAVVGYAQLILLLLIWVSVLLTVIACS